MSVDELARAKEQTERSLRRNIWLGGATVSALIAGLGGWAGLTSISGAVMAQGVVAVETNAKKVQHPEGGVVSELRVREGDRVKAGDLLIRLDDTVLRAAQAIQTKALDELTAQEARLLSERDRLPGVSFPDTLQQRALENADAARSMAGQRNIFSSRKAARETAKSQLQEQIAQLESTIGGLEAQRGAREQELVLIAEELRGVRDLYAKNLSPLNRVTALDRDRTRIEGERGKLIADIASARGTIAEKKIQIARIDDEDMSEIVKELSDVRNRISETVEKKTAAEDRLKRVEMRAPVSGRVHQLNVFTIGGVITGGESAMLIVPENDRLVVDARIEPRDIENVQVGQHAHVRFPGFADRNQQDTDGAVAVISPDLVEDQTTRQRYYKIQIAVTVPQAPEGSELPLVPGMPADVFLAKGNRTVLAYLVKPIADQMRRVFRE